MKIGFEFRDDNYYNKNFTVFDKGNPGVGGTQYEFVLLANYLSKNIENVELTFFHKGNGNVFSEYINEVFYENVNEVPSLAKENHIDILIFWTMHDAIWYKALKDSCVKSIGWAHNFIEYPELCEINSISNIKAVVAVSKEQYELLSAEDCFNKCTYIYNMFDFDASFQKEITNKENAVCYMGALVEPKGFHILAKCWKRVLSEVPDAELIVLGSGATYNDKAKLGQYGITDSKYEQKFMKYLIGENGDIVPSVHFLGNVGFEKYDIIRKCKVGVVNPTGYSETFCISAVEMESQGVPVCSKKIYGLKNTIIDGETGLLHKNNKELADNIIKLLKNNELNSRLANNGEKYAKSFSGSILISKWCALIEAVYNDEQFQRDKIVSHRNLQKFGELRRNKKIILSPYHVEYLLYISTRIPKNILKSILKKMKLLK